MNRWPSHKKLTRADVALAIQWVKAGVTQKAVAETLGVSPTHIGMIVHGLRRQKAAVSA